MKSVMKTDGPEDVDSSVTSVMQTDGSGDAGDLIDDIELNEIFRPWTANHSHTDTYKLPKMEDFGPYQTDSDGDPEHDKANLFVAYASYKGILL